MEPRLVLQEHLAPNDDGWLLHLRQARDPARFQPGLRPVVIIPGYGMNSFIFRFHPRGTSFERALAEAGFEVWTVDLRRQGRSRSQRRNPPAPSLRAYADVDLPAVLGEVLSRTKTSASKVDVIGCSLGGSIIYGHLALWSDHRIHSVVTMGSPLRWGEIPALFQVFRLSPSLIGSVPVVGARSLARRALPVLSRIPGALDLYMNTAHVDLSCAHRLVETVEDPHPQVNGDIARWMRSRDLILRDVNVSHALRHTRNPLLVVVSNRDGIVPDDAALAALNLWGGDDTDLLRIGTPEDWYAHADLFIGNDAPAVVFEPVAVWLHAHN